MDKLRWEELPPPVRGAPKGKRASSIWIRTLLPLREHLNRWAVVKVCRSSRDASRIAHQLRSGDLKKPSGQFEVLSRGAKIYARYTGPE